VIALNSIKKYLAAFSLGVCGFFLVQAYLVFDPHHLTGKTLGTYEILLEQDTILKELAQFIEQQHDARKAMVQDGDIEAHQTITTLHQTIQSHLKTLQSNASTDEWKGAYKTLRDFYSAYHKSQEQFLNAMKSFEPLKDTLMTKSTKPILDLLSEMKLIAQTPSEQKALQGIGNEITTLEERLHKVLQQKSKIAQSLESLTALMESSTKALSAFLKSVETKSDIRTETERLQTLILNYFSSIHQLKTLCTENPTQSKNIESQEGLLVKFIHDLKIGLQENQKELFDAFYQETKAVKKKSVLLSGLIVLLVLGMFFFLFHNVQKPLSALSSFLMDRTNQNLSAVSLEEIQDILRAIESLKEKLIQETQAFFQEKVEESHQKISRKVTLVAQSSLELSKVSGSIAKIPKIFDQKFSAIHKANDEARTHFRHMVYACEELKKLLQDLIKQAEISPALLTSASFEPLRASASQILAQAHEAAVESQALGLRFSSLIRTKDETLEVSKLFSKAGTRVNQLARSLQDDLREFFSLLKL